MRTKIYLGLAIALIILVVAFLLFFSLGNGASGRWGEFRDTILSAVGLSAGPTTYYVNASSGNDSNSGLCQTTAGSCGPLKTIQKGADLSVAGDTVLVAPGTYAEKVTIRRSGASSSPITFRAVGSDVNTYGFLINGYGYITIDGFNVSMPKSSTWDVWGKGSGIALFSANNCVVKNNRISHTLREGISLDSAASNNNSILDNVIEYAGGYAGIIVGGNNNLIEGNDISHTIQHPLYPTLSAVGGPDADGIKFSGSGHIFRRNYIHDITFNDTGNVSPHTDGFQAAGNAQNIIFDGNIISLLNPGASSYTQGIYFDDHPNYANINIRNNIIQVCQPINLDTVDSSAIENNFIRSANCPSSRCNGRVCDGIQLTNSPNTKIRNNLFYSLRSYLNVLDNVSKTGLLVASNGFYDAANSLAGGVGYGSNPINADPKLVNSSLSAFDYRLTSTSPMIDKGMTLTVAFDQAGEARPQGSGYDIGAYEYVVSSSGGGEEESGDVTAPLTTISPAGGIYNSAQTVRFSPNEEAAVQYCLTAGCQPNLDYVSPLNIAESKTVRYHAKDLAGNIEAVKTAVYTIEIPTACVESWQCGLWTACQAGTQTRTCVDNNLCGTTANRPTLSQTCVMPPPEDVTSGLKGEYYNGKNFDDLKLTRTDEVINFNWGSGSPEASLTADNFSVRWTGKLNVTKAGFYHIYYSSDDGMRLWLDGRKILDKWYDHSYKKFTALLYLDAREHDLKVEYYENGGVAAVDLDWQGRGAISGVRPSYLLPRSE